MINSMFAENEHNEIVVYKTKSTTRTKFRSNLKNMQNKKIYQSYCLDHTKSKLYETFLNRLIFY